MIIPYLLIGALVVESLVQFLTKSEIFFPIRLFITQKVSNDWVKTLISCGYCMSFWCASLYILLVNSAFYVFDLRYYNWLQIVILFIINLLILQRLSNMVHGLIDRYFSTEKDIRYNRSEQD